MSQSKALFESVLADPESDGPRLRFADYLSAERIDLPWAELIRTQIALELIGTHDRAGADLIRSERELLDRHQAALERPLRAAIRPSIRTPGSWLRSHLFGSGGTWGFRRGFVEQVLHSAEGFLQEDIALFARTPLRQVLLTNASTHVSELVSEPRLAGLRSLHLVSDADFDEDMQFLLDSARHHGLTVQEVRIPRIDADLVGLLSILGGGDPESDPRIDEFRIWRSARPAQRERLRELASMPRFIHRLNEPQPTTEIELLYQSAWVWLGETLTQQNVWAIAKTFHDLEGDDGLCRHALLCRA